MAQTPVDPEASDFETALDHYRSEWARLNASMRRGVSWSGGERNAAFVRSESGPLDLIDAAPVLGLDHDDDGRAAARIDLDFDGDDDLVVSNRTGPRARVLVGSWATGRPATELRLVGTSSNPEGVGAVAFVTPLEDDEDPPRSSFVPGSTQRRTRTIGSGFLSQSSAWLRFHAREGRSAPAVYLRVRWPGPDGGVVEDFGVVESGLRYVLEEGSGLARPTERPTAVALAPGSAPVDETLAGARRRLVLPVPAPIPTVEVRRLDGRIERLFGITSRGPVERERPLVLGVWNSSDPMGGEALGDLDSLCREAEAEDFDLIALDLSAAADVQPDPLRSGARELATRRWTGQILGATQESQVVLREVVGWRFDRDRAPAGPWWFIVDADGMLAVLRTGPWKRGDFADDLTVVQTPPRERHALAALYPGRWINPPESVDRGRLRERLAALGVDAAVRELDLANVTTVSIESAELQIQLGKSELGRDNFEKALQRFETAIERDPENVLAHRSRAYTLHRLGRFDEALEAWNDALQLDPDDVQTRGNRALAAVAAGDGDVARSDLEVLAETCDPSDPILVSVRRAIAWLEAKKGR